MTASQPPDSRQDTRQPHSINWVPLVTASPLLVGISRAFRAGAYPVPLPRETPPPHAADNVAEGEEPSLAEDAPERRHGLVVARKPHSE